MKEEASSKDGVEGWKEDVSKKIRISLGNWHVFYAYSAVFTDLMQNFLKVGLVTIKSESSAPKAYFLLSPVKK